ncbi:hypothetical protein CN211_15660 [Sinorhizobium meliloti]|nr:hypothetical protein CN211_15660 [Sinorhizobium meliloti]
MRSESDMAAPAKGEKEMARRESLRLEHGSSLPRELEISMNRCNSGADLERMQTEPDQCNP